MRRSRQRRRSSRAGTQDTVADVLDRGQRTGLVLVSRDHIRMLEWDDGHAKDLEESTYDLELGDWRDYRGSARPNPSRGGQSVSNISAYEDRVTEWTARFIKDASGDEPPRQAFERAAEIVGYCVIGANPFAGANGETLTDDVERRIEQALISGTSGDAQLVLLALHAKIVQPSVVDAFDLQAG